MSIRTVDVAGRASPSALVASTCSVYVPSGRSLPSSSRPPHVAWITVPSPPTCRTSCPALSRISSVHVASCETVNPIVILSSTPSPLGLIAESSGIRP